MFNMHSIALRIWAALLAGCVSVEAGQRSPIMAKPVRTITQLVNEAEFIFIIPRNPSVEVVSEEPATISVGSQDHPGKWLTARYPVESYGIKGSVPASGKVLLRMFLGQSFMSRALPTRDRSVVFLERYAGDLAGPERTVLQLLKDDEDWTTFLPIPATAPLPAEDLPPQDKVLHFVRGALYAYEPWSALQPLRLLEACLRQTPLKAKALEILRNAPEKPDEEIFFRILALRIGHGDETDVQQIVGGDYCRKNREGCEILAHAIRGLAGQRRLLEVGDMLLRSPSPVLRVAFAGALGGGYSGQSRGPAVALLARLLDDKDERVQQQAITSLEKYFGARPEGMPERNGKSDGANGRRAEAWKRWWDLYHGKAH